MTSSTDEPLPDPPAEPTNRGIRYSFVVPVYNEVDSLDILHGEIIAFARSLDGACEFIYIDDGSGDGSGEKLREIANQDPRVSVLQFRRNSGKSAAYSAAFAEACGDIVFTLDSDLQDDPAELQNLLDEINRGHDLAVGWKIGREVNEPSRALPSCVFNFMKRKLFGLSLHDSNSGSRAMRLELAKSLVLYGGWYRFIPDIAHLNGYRVTEAGVNHRPRRFGRSKFGTARFWSGLVDLFAVRFTTAFVNKPLQFFAPTATVLLASGLTLEVYALARKLSGSIFQRHIAAIVIGILLILVGFQLLSVGLLGELISHNARAKSQKTSGFQKLKYVGQKRDIAERQTSYVHTE